MAYDKLNNFSFSFVVRNAPKSGPSSSDAWNDSFEEIGNDLANLTLEWRKLVTIIDGLPRGVLDTAVNAFQFGLDGKHMWVDQDQVSTSEDAAKFFNSNKLRPNTIKEQFELLYTTLSNEIASVESTISGAGGGLTTSQKNRIGANIFDSTQVSSATSLDGKSENNRLNTIQIASDVYGTGYTLDNDGSPNLANSVKDMVDALLELHNGNWDDDISLSHVGVITPAQSDINTSHPGNDAFGALPTNLEEDLNRIRTELREIRGTVSWTTSNTALYAGGADSLEDLLVSTAGTGTKTATNPWGYDYSDIDGLNTRLEAIRTFVGQTTQTDSATTYSSTSYISNGDSLEAAIGLLDSALTIVSGFAARVFTDLDDTPGTYAGSSGLFVRVKDSEDGLDFGVPVATVPSDGVFNTITVSGGSAVSTAVTISGNVTVASGTISVLHSGAGLSLVSPDGTTYLVQVSNGGALLTTALP